MAHTSHFRSILNALAGAWRFHLSGQCIKLQNVDSFDQFVVLLKIVTIWYKHDEALVPHATYVCPVQRRSGDAAEYVRTAPMVTAVPYGWNRAPLDPDDLL